jgi:hypothetical protein
MKGKLFTMQNAENAVKLMIISVTFLIWAWLIATTQSAPDNLNYLVLAIFAYFGIDKVTGVMGQMSADKKETAVLTNGKGTENGQKHTEQV